MLNAGSPGASPHPLPQMQLLPGHPGVVYAPGPEGSGMEKDLFARRTPSAWLVVAGAKPAQRLAVLERLRAVVDL